MTTKKSSDPLIVPCRLSDCLYYEGRTESRPGYCYCSHPDKEHYLQNPSCPLYRLDWQKRAKPKQ